MPPGPGPASLRRWVWALGPALESRSLTCLAVGAALLGVAGSVAVAALDGPMSRWADVRTSRAVAIARGFDLYSGPDEPPLSGHIYGPVGFWLYAPATLGRTPSEAVRISTLLAAALLLIPAALVLKSASAGRSGGGLGFRCWATTAFFLQFLLEPGLAWHPHVDAPAIGLAALACWSAIELYRSPASRGWAWACGAALAAAMWAKQTAAPVAVAVPAFLSLVDRRGAAVRSVVAALACGVGIGAASGFLYGFSDVAYTMFAVPAAHPLVPRALMNEWRRFGDLLPLAALFAIGSALRRGDDDGAAPPRAALFLALVGLALLATAVLGRIKEAGNSNNFIAPLYFFTLAAAAFVVESADRPSVSPEWRGWARRTLGAILLLYSAQTLLHSASLLRRRHESAPSDVAFRFARDYPGECFFPERPLASLLAEGRLDPSLWGVKTLADAGVDIDASDILAALPSSVRLIAVESGGGNASLRSGFASLPVADSVRLPGWTIFELRRRATDSPPQ